MVHGLETSESYERKNFNYIQMKLAAGRIPSHCYEGWPSIRAKALSRTNISSAVPEHRVLPERLRTKALEISR